MFGLILAATLASPAPGALIVNHAAHAAGGYTLHVQPAGPAELGTGVTTEIVQRKKLKAQTVSLFFKQLAAAGPLDRLTVRSCAKTMSGTGRITIEYGGKTTPGDLSCGGDANANALLASVRAIEKEAGVAAQPMRRMVPSGDGAGATQ